MDGEPALRSSPAALVREAEKVERLRTALATPLSTLRRETAELDQACLAFVQLQAEIREPPLEFLQAGRRFRVAISAFFV